MLWKILGKVFINKKFTSRKTSLKLKMDIFEIPDIKSIDTTILDTSSFSASLTISVKF